MTDYVAPTGVRVADADRVRLGAHLAEGTTVMHEGFVNFNAGTLGTSMVEGRISAGVVVGDGSDVGGGASIMGTLSGGGAEVISIGERCLLGANAGIGISLGDECTVEAGLYITAGTVITLPDGDDRQGPRAERRERAAVPPQLAHRHRRGAAALRKLAGPQRGPARQRLIPHELDRALDRLERRDEREPQVARTRGTEERAGRDDDAPLEPAGGELVGAFHPQEERRVAAGRAQAHRLERGEQERRAWRGSGRAPR